MQYAPWYAQRCNQSPDVPARSAAARNYSYSQRCNQSPDVPTRSAAGNYSYSNETIHAGLTL